MAGRLSILLVALVAVATVPAVALAADDVTLAADYRLQNNGNSSATELSTPPQMLVATNAAPANVFATELVDGVPRRVLRFPEGNGLQAHFVSDSTDPHSIAVLFRVAYTGVGGDTNYVRLIDWSDGGAENGVYIKQGHLVYFSGSTLGAGTRTIKPNRWTQVVVTVGDDGHVTGYVNGALQFAVQPPLSGETAAVNDHLRFFKDDSDEESAGAVARIRLWYGELTAGEAAALDRVPDVDHDGVDNEVDNCRTIRNGNQANNDRDVLGDVCDPDDDNDGVPDVRDARPLDPKRHWTPATAGNDVLNGGPLADVICGLGGNDVVNGLRGNDTLFGDACNQKAKLATSARARGGKDKLTGGAGRDRLYGGPKNDRLTGGRGRDRIFGGRGNDTINARDGARDRVNCGRGKHDKVRADSKDKLKACEKVKRPRKS